MKKNLPNAITCCNLISGCIATYFAFMGDFSLALLFIVIGAVFDFFDGMTARLLHVSSPIGKELDSLADCITFGFAPSAIIFCFLSDQCSVAADSSLFTLHYYLPFLAFIMAAFSALRLAKFNLDERQATSFIGLPTPANALFWGSLILWMNSMSFVKPYTIPTYYIYIVVALLPVSCWLLVAELPLFALKFKTWGWKGNEVKYIFLITSIPMLLFMGTAGLAAVIAWYVILSLFTQRKNALSQASER